MPTGDERRRRLASARIYLIVTVRGEAAPTDAVERALASGALDILQLRAPNADDDPTLALARDLLAACRRHDVLFIVNDHPHLAAEIDADGAHVGQEDASVAAARAAVGAERLLGLSTHDAAEIARARTLDVDYVGLGPCFPSRSKSLVRRPGGAALVTAGLAAAGDLPVFPIGGIDEQGAAALIEAGTRRLAVGAGILTRRDPAGAARRLASMVGAV